MDPTKLKDQAMINSKILNQGDGIWAVLPALIPPDFETGTALSIVSIFFCAMLDEYYKGTAGNAWQGIMVL